MGNLFGDAFEIESIENVEVIDTDPNVYVKRAEEELKNRRYRNAINEINDAIKYSEDKEHYMLEKVKILNASSYAKSNMRMECINYIKNNLNTFYSDLNIHEFVEVIGYYNNCFNKSKSNITEVLKSKGIPYILGKGYSDEEYINKQLILKKAEVALLEKRLDDALSHINIIEYKYSMDRDCWMVKGQIFKSLKDYDNAIDCFSQITSKVLLDFEAILAINITRCIKYKKVIIGAILAIIILILIQFMLFKYGILPSRVNSYDINVSNGSYELSYDSKPKSLLKQGNISAGYGHTVGLKSDGTVEAVGDNYYGQIDVEGWTDIVAVSSSWDHTVGLKSDGSVVAVGDNYDGRCDVEGWTDIVDISATRYLTAGLKSDGTVVVAGDLNYAKDWTDIVDISAGNYHIVGLKSDGTVVASEVTSVNGNHNVGQSDVEEWTDIVDISAGISHTVGLKSDGTVVVAGENNYGEINVSGWTDIVSTSVGIKHTVGLKLDGTVVAVGDNSKGQCDVEGWSDIVAISAGAYYTVGLKSDGTVVAVGDNSEGQCEIRSWSDIKVD